MSDLIRNSDKTFTFICPCCNCETTMRLPEDITPYNRVASKRDNVFDLKLVKKEDEDAPV